MAQQTITAFFDTRNDAARAMEALVQAGFSRTAIQLRPETETAYRRTEGSFYDSSRDEGGFWDTLRELPLPDEDRTAYSEGMSRGGVLLSITTDEAKVGRVADIVERYGSVDMDEREASWRTEGWTGYTTQYGAGDVGSGSTAYSGRADAAGRGEEAIPIVEEELRIGKRVVGHGRVRIRSYVVETPVEEQVSLREERVRVERRPVDRPVTAADEALFRERTIEAEERAEEAVVSKETRVKEELVVRKDVEERTKTVSDTVRRTEVEVEDERAGDRQGVVSDLATGSDRGAGRRKR